MKVSPQMVKMQIWRPVDIGLSMKFLLEFGQTCNSVSTLSGVNAREMVFRFDPIWPPGVCESVSANGENADLETCRQKL